MQALDLILKLIQPSKVWRGGKQVQLPAAVKLDTVDNVIGWHTLMRVTRDCGKLHYVKIQMLFSACFAVVVLCSLAMLIQVHI